MADGPSRRWSVLATAAVRVAVALASRKFLVLALPWRRVLANRSVTTPLDVTATSWLHFAVRLTVPNAGGASL